MGGMLQEGQWSSYGWWEMALGILAWALSVHPSGCIMYILFLGLYRRGEAWGTTLMSRGGFGEKA